KGRSTGEAIPIREPGDVRARYERGRAATARAEANARRAAAAVVGAKGDKGPYLASSPLGCRAGRHRARHRAQVFARGADERLISAAEALPHEPLFPEYGHPQDRVTAADVTQDAVAVETSPALVHAGASGWH